MSDTQRFEPSRDQHTDTIKSVESFFERCGEPAAWTAPSGFPKELKPVGLFTQKVSNGLEVVLVEAETKPSDGTLRRGWTKRKSGRVSPVLLVAAYRHADGTVVVSVCGPVGDHPTCIHGLEPSQIGRFAAAALKEPTYHAAVRFLSAMSEMESGIPGVVNMGLLATQELKVGVPQRDDWTGAKQKALPLLNSTGRELIEGLGFRVEPLTTNTSVLTVNGNKHAVAVFCDDTETFDMSSQRFEGSSPVTKALAVADRERVKWVILTRAAEIRLYATDTDVGVGRKGREDTYIEMNLVLTTEQEAGYLHLLFSADALKDGGTLENIIDVSTDYAADLASDLRERIYNRTVPDLARAIADRLPARDTSQNLTEPDLVDAYERVMVILFRCLFVAYAEDKDLLPFRQNGRYADHSLSNMARRLAEDQRSDKTDYDEQATSLWDDVTLLWEAVSAGNKDWGVPTYNGTLFSSDPEINEAGAALADIRLSNAEFGPALTAVLVHEGTEGPGPVDFRALSVREFGTIYEGLLESRLSVARDDLVLKKSSGELHYVPADADTNESEVVVPAGMVYFHNRSGVRKATGSYFTKPFAVKHLLNQALEPALDDHIARLDGFYANGDQAGAADAFFDFRCADIAMGSAHFLVTAVDRIERRLSIWLADHPLPAVASELQRLRDTAREQLGDLADRHTIDNGSLLRRQVARHCIYGADKNRVAVELARLAIWVHTFVPGLPLSFLDHNLVCGDSLTGVSAIRHAAATVTPKRGRKKTSESESVSLFVNQLEGMLTDHQEAFAKLGKINDADKAEIDAARTAHQAAREAVAPVEQVFDIATAVNAGAITIEQHFDFSPEQIASLADQPEVRDTIKRLAPIHYPVTWPEVFARTERSGFDCLLGNPPWEQVVVQEHVWWGTYLPRIRSLPIKQMNAEIERFRGSRRDIEALFEQELEDAEAMRTVLRNVFPDLGSGRTDLYKAFAWRNWHLIRQSTGRIGIVLPRTALQTKGSEHWRKTVLADGAFTDVTMLLNNGGWVFDDVHQQYTFGLCSLRKGKESLDTVTFGGPYTGWLSYQSTKTGSESVPTGEFTSWSDDASFPQLPDHPGALTLFRKLKAHPTIGGNRPPAAMWDDEVVLGPTDRPTDLASTAAAGRPQRYDRQAPVHSRRRQVRPHRELDATNDKHRFVLDGGSAAMNGDTNRWLVYKGASFDLWQPDTGVYFASVDSEEITQHLQQKRLRQHKTSTSPFAEFPGDHIETPDTLPCLRPRIAFRNITNSTNTRTVVTALVPGELVITNHAPYLLWPEGDNADEAFLLGVLSSMVLDWYARRVVELNLNFHILNNFPIPDPGEGHHVRDRVVEIAGRLAAVDERFAGWAAEVGVPVGSANDEDVKQDLICELDACVGYLYGLDENDLGVLYDTFSETVDYSDRHAAVLEHYRVLVEDLGCPQHPTANGLE